ncbi:MAG: hypothetical protein PVI99_05440 [Anaerolineales bacterium]|jgi:tetratricopeptide (TPR) repeat protein
MDDVQNKIVDAYKIAAKGNFDHARMLLEEIIYEHPDAIEAWLLLADLSDNRDEARQCYQMVLELDASNWVAQQRMKLLFSGADGFSGAEFSAPPYEFPEEEDTSLDLYDEIDELLEDEDEAEEDHELPADKSGPTLKESFDAHRRLVLGVGGGLVVAFILIVTAWILSVGYIAWRMGYLVLVGN